MNTAQRVLLVIGLGGIAAAGFMYCLDYRTANYWTSGGSLFDNNLRTPEPVLTLSETELAPPTATKAGVVRLTGLYPRRSIGFQTALVGGLLCPVILLIAAGYIALGASSLVDLRSRLRRDRHDPGTTSSAVLSQKQPTWFPKRSVRPNQNLYAFAAVAGARVPALWVLDMPAMLLMMGARFPRLVFAFLLLDMIRFQAR